MPFVCVSVCAAQTVGLNSYVVGVENWYTGHPELIEHFLGTAGRSKAETANAQLDIIVSDLCIKHSFDTSLDYKMYVSSTVG